MAFLVSPGVQVNERDLTNIIPAVATAIGGFAGRFQWGPVNEVTTVSGEADLITKFGHPNSSAVGGNRLDWYSAANFLQYSNNLQVVRVADSAARNAVANVDSETVTITYQFTRIGTGNVLDSDTLSTDDGWDTLADDYFTLGYGGGNFTNLALGSSLTDIATQLNTWAAGNDNSLNEDFDHFNAVASGDTITVTLGGADLTADQYIEHYSIVIYRADGSDVIDTGWNSTDGTGHIRTTVTESDPSANALVINNANEFLETYETADGLTGATAEAAKYPGALGNGLGVVIIDAAISDEDFTGRNLFGTTTASDLFDTKPGTSVWANNIKAGLEDEVHVVVYTTDNTITGTTNEVLETFAYLSKARNAVTADNAPNYYVNVINTGSQWIWIGASGTLGGDTGVRIGLQLNSAPTEARFRRIRHSTEAGIYKASLKGGVNSGSDVTSALTTAGSGYALLNDVEALDVSLLITGDHPDTVKRYVVENVAEERKDAIAFVSPSRAAAVVNPSATKIDNYFNSTGTGNLNLKSTSYAVLDSGWKRQYDRYNDEYFWMPLNADVAGVTAQSEQTTEAWFSPAGLNRGFIKDVVKLSFNPTQTDRDTLYPRRINPVVSFRGQGTLLYGDKTALSRPSAFDRINVRRLFIVLEKAIATAARYQLFEFNDEFTRSIFINAVEPFLSDVRSRRGVTDFRVVCDTSNNTPEVIDSNRFVADIYIKPNRSINFITLNFTAVRSGVSFSEIAG